MGENEHECEWELGLGAPSQSTSPGWRGDSLIFVNSRDRHDSRLRSMVSRHTFSHPMSRI